MSVVVWLARHGETESNRLHILQGALDVPLNAAGELQAQQLARRMQSLALCRVYSSHLSRAKSTAQAIASAGRAVEVQVDPRLGEFDCGVFQGLERAVAQQRYPREWSRYRVDEHFVVPEGESYHQFADRVCDAFEDITSEAGDGDEGDICIVAHGGVLDCIKNTYLTLPEGGDHRCANASLCKITWVDGRWRVDEWNCTKHLVGDVQQVADDIL